MFGRCHSALGLFHLHAVSCLHTLLAAARMLTMSAACAAIYAGCISAGVSFTWQIAALAACDSEDDTGAADEEAAAAVAQTAQQMLLQLATDPRHGLADPQHDGAAAEPAGQQSPGLHY